jgi:hypothetical protein
MDHVRRLRSDNPRDLVVVFVPEYVVNRWWEGMLHNQSALRLKLRLLSIPGVVVTSVPYHLGEGTVENQPVRRARTTVAGS